MLFENNKAIVSYIYEGDLGLDIQIGASVEVSKNITDLIIGNHVFKFLPSSKHLYATVLGCASSIANGSTDNDFTIYAPLFYGYKIYSLYMERSSAIDKDVISILQWELGD